MSSDPVRNIPIKVGVPKGIVMGDNIDITIKPDTIVSEIARQMAQKLDVEEKNWNLLFIKPNQGSPARVGIAKPNDVVTKVFPEVTAGGRLYFRPSLELR